MLCGAAGTKEKRLKGDRMTDTKIIVQNVDFPLEPWRIEGERSELIQPIKGTWTLAPNPLIRLGVKGLISCPNCAQAALIKHDMGEVINGVNELKSFSCQQCGFMCHARLLAWDTRKLFCIAYEALDKDGLVLPDSAGETVRKEYTHAESREVAFRCFVEVRKHYGRFRVIDVGEVIGYFGKESDKDQVDLTV